MIPFRQKQNRQEENGEIVLSDSQGFTDFILFLCCRFQINWIIKNGASPFKSLNGFLFSLEI